MRDPRCHGLYVITDPELARGRGLVPLVAEAIGGGARLVQYRDKSDDGTRRYDEAAAVLALCRAHGVPLIVNDDVELAAEIGADGVHLGRDDARVEQARRRLGSGSLIGVSCYDRFELAVAARAAGADYVAFGSFFPSTTKPGAVRADVGLLERARRELRVPVVAIGGITPENGAALIAAGADMLAVINAVFGAPDVRAAAAAVARLFPDRGNPMSRSHDLYLEAQRRIPGGVNSPVRAFRGVGGDPVFFDRGAGAHLYDVDGRRYLDYVGSWGPMILGHAHPEVIDAVTQAVRRGLSFGAPTALENRMAEKVCELVPSIEMVRMVSSGTEATMSAIRLARGYTGRDKIVKFEGCYHGHADSLLVKAGSGALTLGQPSSPGVPPSLAEHTLTLDYNDADQVHELFARTGEQIACVIVEPVAGNMSCIPPVPDFLETLREACDEFGALLIFDEVMTGFRVALGGAQELYGVNPDLTTLGKVIGGGMPVGAFGGRRDVMEKIAPLGPVYQAGTLSGNPVAMTAGLKTLELIAQPGFFDALAATTERLATGLVETARQAGVPLAANAVGGMFGIFFTDAPQVTSYAQATSCNVGQFQRFYHAMLRRGVYLAPSAFEAGFVSAAHTDAIVAETLDAAAGAFAEVT